MNYIVYIIIFLGLVLLFCYKVFWKKSEPGKAQISGITDDFAEDYTQRAREIRNDRINQVCDSLKARLQNELVLHSERFHVGVYSTFSMNGTVRDFQITSGGGFFGIKMFVILVDFTNINNPKYQLEAYRGNPGFICYGNNLDELIKAAQKNVSLWETVPKVSPETV